MIMIKFCLCKRREKDRRKKKVTTKKGKAGRVWPTVRYSKLLTVELCAIQAQRAQDGTEQFALAIESPWGRVCSPFSGEHHEI
jgi:hypothetical protein